MSKDLRVITVRLPEDEYQRALLRSRLFGVSLNRFCRHAIDLIATAATNATDEKLKKGHDNART